MNPGFYWDCGYKRQIVRYVLVGLALLVVAGARHYSMLQFLGIQQIRKEAIHSAMTGSGDFNEIGVLGLVQHPWVCGGFHSYLD